MRFTISFLSLLAAAAVTSASPVAAPTDPVTCSLTKANINCITVATSNFNFSRPWDVILGVSGCLAGVPKEVVSSALNMRDLFLLAEHLLSTPRSLTVCFLSSLLHFEND